MTPGKPSNLPIVLMSMWYLALALGSLMWFFFGLLFGSEVYRGGGIPLAEWAMIAGPLFASVGLLTATIVLWNKGKRQLTYWLLALSIPAAFGLLGLSGFLTLI